MNEVELTRLVKLFKVGMAANAVLATLNVATLFLLLVFVIDEPAQVAGVDPMAAQTVEIDEDPTETLREFFTRTSDLLDRAARRAGSNPAEVLPTQDAIDAAVESRTIHSDESQAVLQTLREGYDLYDLDWPLVTPQH